MKNWVKKIWGPFILLSLAVALCFEFESVETFNHQGEKDEVIVSAPKDNAETLKTKPPPLKVIPRWAS